MATPSKPKPHFATDETTHVEDMQPPEFNNNNEHPLGSEDVQTVGLTLDALKGSNLDSRRMNQAQAEITPPAGDWIRSDRWVFDPNRNLQIKEGDSLPGDMSALLGLPHQGRMIFLFAGKPDKRYVNGIDYEPMFFVRMSPDVRRQESDPTKYDMAYQLFLQAREAYLSIHGEELTSTPESEWYEKLIYLMTEDKIIIRSMKGDSGPFVVGVRAPNEKRQQQRRQQGNG